ncbi:MAG: hypothetical protein R3Y28_05595 [Candidatus Gastranaerophilales bacterium]
MKIETKPITYICNSFSNKSKSNTISRIKAQASDAYISQNHILEAKNRFSTPDAQLARRLNQIAIEQIKTPINYEFSKATPEDFIRLTDPSKAASYKRCVYTNPKDKKVYHLLEENRKENGEIDIRILDKDGEFVKNATIQQKKIIIIDEPFSEEIYNLNSHGALVTTYVERTNPFADVTFRQGVGDSFFDAIETTATEDECYDYLSLSVARNFNKKGKRHQPFTKQLERFHRIFKRDEIDFEFEKLTKVISQKGTRIFESSGNEGKNGVSYNSVFLNDIVESCGSLSPQAKVAKFSAGRNSGFTKHYELGVYQPRYIVNDDGFVQGINITGNPGTDVEFKTSKQIETARKNLKEKISKLKGSITPEEMENLDCDSCVQKFSDIILYQNQLESLQVPIQEIFAMEIIDGTSFSVPVRVAKMALIDMMEGII